MGKRKASVLTTSDSTDSRLEASYNHPGHVEPGVGEPVQSGTDLNLVVPVGLSQPTVGLLEASPLNRSLAPVTTDPDGGLVGGSRHVTVADVTSPPRDSQEGLQVSATDEELGSRTEAAVEAFWAPLNELGYEPL